MLHKFNLYKNYAIIGAVSIICLLFFPFVGSSAGLAIILPNTFAGWLVYIVGKAMVACVNMLILYCFVSQGKFNVRDNPQYLSALSLLGKISPAFLPKPISPKAHYRQVYGFKGTTLFLTTILGTFSLTQAILVFDAITFITYLITIITGIIFGVIQMGQEETYWTEDFPYYVNCLIEKEKTKEKANVEQDKATSSQDLDVVAG